MGELSQKNTIFTILCITIALFMSGCPQPLNINEFLGDEKVQDVINSERVNLIQPMPDKHLIAGNQRISGFRSGHYYRVEAEDENGDPVPASSGYVRANGQLGTLGQIGRFEGTMLGLNNDYTYTVWYASPLTGSMTVYDPANTAISPPYTVGNSGLTIPDTYENHTLALPTGPGTNAGSLYAIVSSSNTTTTATIPGSGRIPLVTTGTTDYIFHDTSDPNSFRVLKVSIEASKRNLVITVTYASIIDPAAPLQLAGAPITVSVSEIIAGNVEFLISGTVPDLTAIRWHLNGRQIYPGNNFALAESDLAYMALGSNTVSVEFVINGVSYSKSFTYMLIN